MRLCSISVDLDEVHHYSAVHGVPTPAGKAAHAGYDIALDRQRDFARDQGLPLTLFIIGRDLDRTENVERLRRMVSDGHEPGNHSLDHFYDLTRREARERRSQIEEGAERIERELGVAPKGFRAPGYTVTDDLFESLTAAGVTYDSSVFPCPPYYAAKALSLLRMRFSGRASRSIVDAPSVLRAPIVPYHVGRPYWQRGSGMLELPIGVAGPLRLPFIGTALSLLGPNGARLVARSLIGQSFINLELHAIDFLDTQDGLVDLARHQPDLSVPVAKKLETFAGVVELLRRGGYSFVRLDEAARVFR